MTAFYAFSILSTGSARCQLENHYGKAQMGELVFICFFPYQTKMRNYYLNVSKFLDQEIGHEPLVSLASN